MKKNAILGVCDKRCNGEEKHSGNSATGAGGSTFLRLAEQADDAG